jgi:ribonuclease P protein component
MLSKSSRLPASEFRAHGYKTARTPYFLLKARPNLQKSHRIGIVIGVAAAKTAVRRNFWKRQAKAMIAHIPPQRTMDILIIFSKNIASLTKAQFKAEFIKAYLSLI